MTTSYSSPDRTKLPVGTVDASVARTLARGGWRVRVRRACISCLSVDETGAAGARRGGPGLKPGPDRGPVPPGPNPITLHTAGALNALRHPVTQIQSTSSPCTCT